MKIIFWYVFMMFCIAFFISIADIPYFLNFFQRLSVGVFNWFAHPSFVIKMIFQEPQFFVFVIIWFIVAFMFYKVLKKLFAINYENMHLNVFYKFLIFLILGGLTFLSIRGRIAKKSPIRIGTAYFCNDPFLNQLGLNPVFTLIKTTLNSRKPENQIELVGSPVEAIQKVRKYLNINDTLQCSPIARKITFSEKPNYLNVILVIMESMSYAKTGLDKNGWNLTPFLDSLANESLFFSSTYTAGEHTFNGIFSTLFSFHALFRKHPMEDIKRYDGIATVLKKNGYTTTYFTTHDTQFDNVEGFLRNNDFERIIGEPDYPSDKVKTTLGVPDDFMFRFSIPIINELYKQGKPFFVTFMTASDHGPYYVPEYFHPQSQDPKKQTVEYADWSLRIFLNEAKKQEWFFYSRPRLSVECKI